MAGTFPSPLDLAPSVPASATRAQCIAAWLDLMDACDQFVLAGLRREIGPDGGCSGNHPYRATVANVTFTG